MRCPAATLPVPETFIHLLHESRSCESDCSIRTYPMASSRAVSETFVSQSAETTTKKFRKQVLFIPDLPKDVFLLILAGLDAWDMVRCRRVARAWRDVFSEAEFLQIKLREYTNAREVQDLHQSSSLSTAINASTNWGNVFDKIASRYYHLSCGKARCTKTYTLAPVEQTGEWYPVNQWTHHESQPCGRLYPVNARQFNRRGDKPCLFRPTLWTYDDGLLVCAQGESEYRGAPISGPSRPAGYEVSLVLYDLEQDRNMRVPFELTGRVLRNLRLKDRTLVVEWAEKDPWHGESLKMQCGQSFVAIGRYLPLRPHSHLDFTVFNHDDLPSLLMYF